MKYLNNRNETSIPVVGTSNLLLVHRIFCVGRNYMGHIDEMKYDKSENPFIFFMKPPEAIIRNKSEIKIPSFTNNYEYEIELALIIGKEGKNISVKSAKDYIFGYSVGIDMTCRDIQSDAKRKGLPWTLAKSLPFSAPISDITLFDKTKDLTSGKIELKINNQTKQKSDIKYMIRNTNEIISELSTYYTLYPGDIVFTGTPEGVGSLSPGDRILAEIEGIQSLQVSIS